MQTLSLPTWATAPRSSAASWDAHTLSRVSGRGGSGYSIIASADSHRDPWAMRRMQASVQDALRRQAALRMVAGALLRMVVGPEPDIVFKSSDEAFNKEARRWFERARETRRFEYRRMQTLGEMAEAALLAALDAGRIVGLKINDGSTQLVESARLVNPTGAYASNTREWKDGVRINPFGRPVSYWIAPWNDQGSGVDAAGGAEVGFERVLYLLNPILPDIGATTREPALQSAIEWMDSIAHGVNSTNTALLQATDVGLIWEHPYPKEFQTYLQNFGAEGSEGGEFGTASQPGTGVDATRESAYGIEIVGPKGFTAKQIDPKHPNPQLEWFFLMQLRIIAASMGMPLEAVLFLFNQSYTAHRAAFATCWPTIEKLQGWLVNGFLCHVVRHAMAADIRSGAFSPAAVPDDWRAIEFILPVMPIFDQKAEVEAAVLRMQNNLATLEDETRKLTGRDSAEVLIKREAEVLEQREKKIEPPQMPGSRPTGEQMAKAPESK